MKSTAFVLYVSASFIVISCDSNNESTTKDLSPIDGSREFSTRFGEFNNWPTPGTQMGEFGFFADSAAGSVNVGEWSTFDIDGDHRPDLVITSDDKGQLGIPSSPHWLVYKNTGTGFESSPIIWTTPYESESSKWGFYRTALSTIAGSGTWSTFDINGDELPDLVFTSPVTAQQFDYPASPYWKVYLNTGSSFDSIATRWPTPSSSLAGTFGFFSVSAAAVSDAGEWSTFDIDGDHRPDLVITSDNVQQLGFPTSPHWLVYKNNGTGFNETPTKWETPYESGSSPWGFYRTSLREFSDAGVWSTFDINGDKRPDLIFTSPSGNPQFGHPNTPYWKVYFNTGNGFAKNSTQWNTPIAQEASTFGFFADSAAGSTNSGDWSTFDINGDRQPDLVITSDDSGQPGFPNTPHWQVYKNIGTGFDSTPIEWDTPYHSGSSKFGFYRIALRGITNFGVWSTFDINGDTYLDLVFTSPNGKGQFDYPDSPYWKVAFGIEEQN